MNGINRSKGDAIVEHDVIAEGMLPTQGDQPILRVAVADDMQLDLGDGFDRRPTASTARPTLSRPETVP